MVVYHYKHRQYIIYLVLSVNFYQIVKLHFVTLQI